MAARTAISRRMNCMGSKNIRAFGAIWVLSAFATAMAAHGAEPTSTASGRKHWAYQNVKDPAVPEIDFVVE